MIAFLTSLYFNGYCIYLNFLSCKVKFNVVNNNLVIFSSFSCKISGKTHLIFQYYIKNRLKFIKISEFQSFNSYLCERNTSFCRNFYTYFEKLNIFHLNNNCSENKTIISINYWIII